MSEERVSMQGRRVEGERLGDGKRLKERVQKAGLVDKRAVGTFEGD